MTLQISSCISMYTLLHIGSRHISVIRLQIIAAIQSNIHDLEVAVKQFPDQHNHPNAPWKLHANKSRQIDVETSSKWC